MNERDKTYIVQARYKILQYIVYTVANLRATNAAELRTALIKITTKWIAN